MSVNHYDSLPCDPDERRLYAESLRKHQTRSTVRILARLLADDDLDVRLAAVESLEALGSAGSGGEISADDCAVALAGALGDDNAHIRWRAAMASGVVGSKETVFSLLRLLHDENKHVAWAAVDALEAIGDPSVAHEIEKFKKSRLSPGG